jgi:hypothetical protein
MMSADFICSPRAVLVAIVGGVSFGIGVEDGANLGVHGNAWTWLCLSLCEFRGASVHPKCEGRQRRYLRDDGSPKSPHEACSPQRVVLFVRRRGTRGGQPHDEDISRQLVDRNVCCECVADDLPCRMMRVSKALGEQKRRTHTESLERPHDPLDGQWVHFGKCMVCGDGIERLKYQSLLVEGPPRDMSNACIGSAAETVVIVSTERVTPELALVHEEGLCRFDGEVAMTVETQQ